MGPNTNTKTSGTNDVEDMLCHVSLSKRGRMGNYAEHPVARACGHIAPFDLLMYSHNEIMIPDEKYEHESET